MKALRSILPAAAILAAASLTSPLVATNGMNMEGYGPVATALGGASFAYDNGTAAVINNPATLSLMPDQARLDLALGVLGPDITATSTTGIGADSSSTAFFMPAFGYARRSGDLVYGFGVFGQGGMGCEYDANSWRGLGFGLVNRTEVSVGRAILPLAWKINDRLHLAASADFIWAGMDLKMAMSGAQFFDLVNPMSQQFGRASGTIIQGFNGMMATLPAGTGVDYAYFNFSNGSDFTGAARGYGYAGKIGLLYEVSPRVSLGLTYHSRSALGDLTTSNAALSFQLNIPGMGPMAQTLTGDMRVNNFEWPAMLGAGLAYRPNDRWLLVADVREIFWKDVMQDFSMTFTANGNAANGPFANQVMDATLFQNWENQFVLQLGAAYQVNGTFTLRVGGNFSSDPIPDKFLNCLFPATIERHLTAGFGWKLNERSTVDVSVTRGFKVEKINGYGIGVSHAQTNAQVMYSYRF
ncbi:MAG: outer membrane protein transport protein [Candidatus Didemnitutus sp.]|nr:outer membrane protein transport protein [Candidatus Didemnitutus sp.]